MNETPDTSPQNKSLAAVTVAGVTSVQMVATMAVIIPAAIAPKLAAALDVPVSMIGFQVSFAYVGATLMSLAAGLVVRRMGALRTNQIAAFLVTASLLAISIPHIAALLFGTFGIGVAYGLTNPAASTLMMKIASPANRNLIFSIKQTGQPMGGVVAGLMAPTVAVMFGWQAALYTGAAIAFVVMLAIQPLRVRLDTDRDPTTKFRGAVFRDLGVVWRNRGLRLLSMAALMLSGVQLALMTFAVTMLVEDVHLDLVTAGTGLAVLQVAGVIGRLVWGVVADKVRNGIMTLIVSQVLSVLAAWATVALVPDTPILTVYAVLAGFGFSAVGWNGVFMAEIARLAPDGQIGSATGGALVPTFLGVIIGPILFTGLHQLIGSYTGTFAALSAVTVLGLVPMYLIARIEKAPKMF